MSKRIIPHEAERSKKLNEHLQGLHNLYKEDVQNAVNLCYELGATQEQIAEALGISRSAVATHYPRKEANRDK